VFTLFFVSPEELQDEQIRLTGSQAHHAISVLRVQRNEMIRLADGVGRWIEGAITELAKDSLTVQVVKRGADTKSHTSITIAQALLKGDNQKAALDQLVQAGVDAILPWQAERSISAHDKSEKWREVIVAAARQSRQSRIPELIPMTNLNGLISAREKFDVVIALHESASSSLSSISQIAEAKKLLVIIGPEGGLSDTELDQFGNKGIPLVKLGDPVIRADLAGAIAIGAIHVLTKEW
jgi:16S rRNA (uracil1498-N3)-methyltransferase